MTTDQYNRRCSFFSASSFFGELICKRSVNRFVGTLLCEILFILLP